MSSRSVSDFEAALKQAQNQLDWGTEIKDIRDAARSLRILEPSHPLVGQLDVKIARLIKVRAATLRSPR